MLYKIENFLKKKNIDYLLVNCTNEWLEETPNLKESSVYKLTGFKGDTGDVLIDKKLNCYIFVDGRYHLQAEKEVKNFVNIIKLKNGQKQDNEICKIIKKNSNFAFFSKKISFLRFENFQKLLKNKNINFIQLENDIINHYNKKNDNNFQKSGCKPKKIDFNSNVLVTKPENVSYLTQYRNFSQEGISKIYAKLFIYKNGKQKIFKTNQELKAFLQNYNDNIYIEKNINMYDYSLIKKPIFKDLNINNIKSIKTKKEIKSLKKAFKISDKSLIKIRKFINKNIDISEFDIYKKLKYFFLKNGATGVSFKPIVAINKNSSLAHYNNYSKKLKLKDGDLVLIDCGIYTKEGLATDTTRVFVKGTPNELQKKVYTLTLKAFLNCYSSNNKNGYELNNIAHDILDKQITTKNKNDFFVFNHGLGHGIGISVHESPPSLNYSNNAKNNIKNGMCFTIEPGLYHKNYFGIRLENSFYRENNKNKTLTKIGFEKKLIDFNLLNKNEKKVLKKFKLLK